MFLLWYEVVKKKTWNIAQKTISIAMPTVSYWLLPTDFFSFSLLTRSNTDF